MLRQGFASDGETRTGGLTTGEDIDMKKTITRLLLRWRAGDEHALDDLMPRVYEELRRLARIQMRGERADHTLQPTALVHEAYARMVDLEVPWRDRVHFLSMAARAMRRVLIEHARARNAEKRGRGTVFVSLTEARGAARLPPADLLGLDEALKRFSELEERASRVLELYYFGGLSYREIAEAVGISTATAERDLRLARAWLRRELDRS